MYREPANSPFVPKIQQQLIERDKPEQSYKPQEYPPKKYPPPSGPGGQPGGQPVVDLKVWQSKPPPKPMVSRDKIPPVMYMPSLAQAQTPYFPPQFNPNWPYYTPQVVSPVVKQYSINNGPFVNYTTLSVIKEDALPEQFSNTSNTLGERLNIYNFVRSVFVRHHDGEDIDLDGKGTNSLLSYLKFMELNPYTSINNPNNPYIGLPDDMLIYRSCYPIRYDQSTNRVQCAPNSIGMNIRIYKLTNAEYNIQKLEQKNFYDFNVWREIVYYEYVREQIIKTKICPNFALLYCYYISEKCNVDFNKVKLLKRKPSSLIPDPQRGATLPCETGNCPPFIPQPKNTLKNTLNAIESVLDKNSGKGLVALTEGPTYNMYGWSSKQYQGTLNANVHTMVNTGYHKSEVWMSVLFQLLVALYVMQLHKIAFNNFSIEDNVYIKDISEHDNVVMYWKYRINEFDYYIPNYGYLLLIDSNFKDLESSHQTFNTSTNKKFKIYGSIFKDSATDAEIQKKCFDAFRTAFNTNSFTKAFTNFGGTKPPEDILALIKRIHDDASTNGANQDISHYIYTYMGKLLNNRVGTYLTEIEGKNVRKDDTKEFKQGQIVVQEIQNETYKFAIYVSQNNNQVTILTKEDQNKNDMIEKKVAKDVLFNYSRYDNIVQNYKPMEANLNEEELLETYVVGK